MTLGLPERRVVQRSVDRVSRSHHAIYVISTFTVREFYNSYGGPLCNKIKKR
jgi:hypothetical protein